MWKRAARASQDDDLPAATANLAGRLRQHAAMPDNTQMTLPHRCPYGLANELIPLVDRPRDSVLFEGEAGRVTAAAFLADAMRCAALLHDADHVVNGCVSRYWFAVGVAASLLRGQISLLTGDHSPRALDALGRRFSRVQFLSDVAGSPGTLPGCVIGPSKGELVPVMGDVPRLPANQPAVVVFTSGSTGEPVGTAKSFGELAVRSHAAAERLGFTQTDPVRIIGTVPPHHMYGFETTILLPFHGSASSWCDTVFYPADLQAALASGSERTILVTTPLQLRAMLAVTPASRVPDAVISATAPLETKLAADAERLWKTEVLEIFGATEVGSIASRRTVAGPHWSVYPGVHMAGEDGPLVSAPFAAARRLNDVVELSPDGTQFRVLGRCGDMVKLGGRRASLAGLTHLLTSLPGVEDGVFLTPDDFDSRPTARLLALFVSGLPGEAVLEALRHHIDPIFMPRPLIQVPELPRNAVGKLPRAALLALAAQYAPANRDRACL